MSTEFEESGATKAQAPEFLPLEDTDLVVQRKAFARLKAGVWMPAEVVARKHAVAKTGSLSLQLSYAPVDESGNVVKNGRVRQDIYLPQANRGARRDDGSYEGFINPKTGKQHEAPNTVFGCYMTALSMDSSFPRYPKKVRLGVYENRATGELLNQEQTNAEYRRIDALVIKTMNAWYNDSQALLGNRLYIFIEEETSASDGKIYSKVTKTRAEAPDDEPVITSDFFVSEGS